MLTALTWNVFFGGHRFEERCAAIVERIYRADADLVALQEVTPELHAHLCAAPWASEYEMSDPGATTLGDYGVLVLSRLPVEAVDLNTLPTRMGRSLLVVDVDARGTPFTFATAHLESMDESGVRVEQLARAFALLGAHASDALFVGDFNFPDGAEPETAALDPAFTDTWRALRPDDPGYTVDTDVNLMRWQIKEKVTRKRIDRILARGRVRPVEISLHGDRPVGGDPTLFPSDHFGVKLRFELSHS